MAFTPEELARSGTEHGEQAALFAAFATPDMRAQYPQLERLCFAVPNGGARGDTKRSASINGAMMRAEGVKPGVSDIFVAVPQVRRTPRCDSPTSYFGLFVEMKRADGGVESDAQKAFGAAVTEQGYAYVVCHGWRQAYATIRAYMDGLL